MYSPKIAEDLIPILFRIATREGRPMTKVVDDILRAELRRRGLLDRGDSAEEGD